MSGADKVCRAARRSSALRPLISRSMSNKASMRCTASRQIGERTVGVLRGQPGAHCQRCRPAQRTSGVHGPNMPLPGSARACVRARRACRSRHRRRPVAARHILPGGSAGVRLRGRASSGTPPPAAPVCQTAGRRAHTPNCGRYLAPRQDRHRGVVAVQSLGDHDMGLQAVEQWHQHRRAGPTWSASVDRLSGTPSRP